MSDSLQHYNFRDDKDFQEALEVCYVHTKVFSKTFFPDRFHVEFSELHDQIFDLIDSGKPKIAIAAPRGIGKTSIVSLAYAAKKILYREMKFFVYVSNSATSGELQTENLKHAMVSNKLIKTVFGPMKVKSGEGIDESFSKKSWVAAGNTLVYPRGSGQQVRGILFHNARPDFIVIDDLEDTETITNEELRKKRKEWFYADLMKCVSRVDKNYQIVYIDTLKHEDALLEELIESSEWDSLRLEMFDDNYNSNAPVFMSNEEIEKEVIYHREKGLMDVLYREFRNIPISTEDAAFKPEYFKYYEEPDITSKRYKTHIRNVVIVDPAKTVKLHSAESAVVCWGVDQESHAMYFRDCVAEKFYPDELYDAMFEMVLRFKAPILAVEVTSLNEFIVQPIKNEMKKRGIHPNFIELKARDKKENRIAQLVPFYRMGYVYHNKNACTRLESQLIGFPRSKYWDVMDAAAYIIEVLELDEHYFDPVDFMPEDDESVYAELENDDPVEEWRYAV